MKNGLGYHRFAISVNRKIGTSVQRNYIKRKAKELFRLNRKMVEDPHDVWIVTKRRFEKSDAAEIEYLFEKGLKRINQWIDRPKK